MGTFDLKLLYHNMIHLKKLINFNRVFPLLTDSQPQRNEDTFYSQVINSDGTQLTIRTDLPQHHPPISSSGSVSMASSSQPREYCAPYSGKICKNYIKSATLGNVFKLFGP